MPLLFSFQHMSNLMMCSNCHCSVMVHELHYGLCRSCVANEETAKRRKADDEHQQMVNTAVMTACLATTLLS